MRRLSKKEIVNVLAGVGGKDLQGIVGVIVINEKLNVGMGGDLRALMVAAREAIVQYEIILCDAIRPQMAAEDKQSEKETT